jgi:hypothetical protein
MHSPIRIRRLLTPSAMIASAALATALCALASATAFAAGPEFKVAGGKFPTTFTGKSEAVDIQVQGAGLYVCSSSTISGEIVGPKEVAKVVIKFGSKGGCGGYCTQTGHEGWETKEMKGTIGVLSKKEGTQVGLLLEPVAEPVASCLRTEEGANTKIIGSIIGQIGPVGVKRTAFQDEYRQSSGVQQFRSFEAEEAIHDLRPTLAIQGGIQAAMSLTTAKEVEIVG